MAVAVGAGIAILPRALRPARRLTARGDVLVPVEVARAAEAGTLESPDSRCRGSKRSTQHSCSRHSGIRKALRVIAKPWACACWCISASFRGIADPGATFSAAMRSAIGAKMNRFKILMSPAGIALQFVFWNLQQGRVAFRRNVCMHSNTFSGTVTSCSSSEPNFLFCGRSNGGQRSCGFTEVSV